MTDPFSSPAPASGGGPSRFTLDTLLDHLGGAVEEEADGYLVRCPAHDDSHASLRVGLTDDGKVLLKCRAGCDFAAVLKAADLKASDLFRVAPGSAVRVAREDQSPVSVEDRAALAFYLHRTRQALQDSPTAQDAASYAERRFGLHAEDLVRLGLGYDDGTVDGGQVHLSRAQYHDAPRLVVPFNDFDGNPHYLQARAISGSPKAKWSGPSNPDGAAWGKFGVFRSGTGWDDVIVTEGPGDALTAVAAGYDAVLIRGAGLGTNEALTDEIARGVNGRRVVIAGDADNAGVKFTNDVAAALSSKGIDVYRLTIPPGVGSDLTDWREHGGTAFSKGFPKAVMEAAPYGSDEIVAERIMQTITRLFSDVYNAEVLHDLIRESGADVRWTPEVGFLVYEEAHGVWRQDGDEWVRRHAHGVAERVQEQILAEMQTMDADVAGIGDKDLREQAGKYLDAHRKKARNGGLISYTLSTPGIDRMIREIRALPNVTSTLEAFDRHPRLLPCRNGVVNLETGEITPFSEETKHLNLMRRVDLEYVPGARNPRWEQFLAEIFPDREDLVRWVKTLIGYGITGLTTEQCFAILWGSGSNGKSVFMDTLTAIFRGITVTTPFSTFEARQSGGIPNDLAALKGARLVMASEGDREKKMAEATIKNLTGSDMISARYLHREFFEFKPTFLILLATNYRPNFRGQDEGIWRRVKLVPFVRTFKKADKDVYLSQKFLGEFVPRSAYKAGEDFGDGAAGILAWAIEGAAEYLQHGLQDTPEVEAATKEYRQTSDRLSGFLGDDTHNVLIKDAKGRVTGKEVWDLYREWIQDEGLDKKDQWTRTTLFDALEERGAAKKKSGGAFYFTGIRRVKPSEAVAEAAAEAEAAEVPQISSFSGEQPEAIRRSSPASETPPALPY